MPRDRDLEDTRLDPLGDWGGSSDVEKNPLGWDLYKVLDFHGCLPTSTGYSNANRS